LRVATVLKSLGPVKALEQAIENAPDDPEPYLVYADWLQRKHDPRGELIMLQHAGTAKTPQGAKARTRAKQLLAQHADVFLGELAAYPVGSWHMGLELTWRLGFIERVELDYRTADGKTELDAVTCVEQLLAHPSARFLRELVVHAVDGKTNDYRPIVKLLCAKPRLTLERLTFDALEYYGPTKSIIGDVSKLWKSCPNLISLDVVAQSIALGKIVAPKLRRLSIDDRVLSKQAVASIGAATWPALESLALRPDGDAPAFTADALLPILTGRGLPKLTELRLNEIREADQLCEALAASKLAGQLETLDLSLNGWLTDAGARALASRKGGWPKLELLALERSGIEKAGKAALKGICPKLKLK
jgi:uncharacterized protein (TIGR02996 family)